MSRAAALSLLALSLVAAAPYAARRTTTRPSPCRSRRPWPASAASARSCPAPSTGDTDATARDVERELQKLRWLRMVERDPEVKVTVDRRERTETSRSTDKKGGVTINHRYTASASLQIGGNRDRIDADTTYSQGPTSTRDDAAQFDNVAKELAKQIASASRRTSTRCGRTGRGPASITRRSTRCSSAATASRSSPSRRAAPRRRPGSRWATASAASTARRAPTR